MLNIKQKKIINVIKNYFQYNHVNQKENKTLNNDVHPMKLYKTFDLFIYLYKELNKIYAYDNKLFESHYVT